MFQINYKKPQVEKFINFIYLRTKMFFGSTSSFRHIAGFVMRNNNRYFNRGKSIIIIIHIQYIML